MDGYLAGVSALVKASGTVVINYMLVLAAVGTSAMAIVDALKAISRARGTYQRRQVRQWVRRAGGSCKALEEFVSLASGSAPTESAWWDQPSEKIFARFRGAAETALDFPDDFSASYYLLVRCVGLDTLQRDAQDWHRVARDWRANAVGHMFTDRGRDVADLRARLGAAIARHLEALQWHIDWWWALYNQLSAQSVAIISLMVIHSQLGLRPLEAAFLAVAGGLLAPFAKNISSRLTDATASLRS